ncbi:MAG: hypothetical protein GY719_07050 [bacterium]|nr:hypothetical protein [bacterium]
MGSELDAPMPANAERHAVDVRQGAPEGDQVRDQERFRGFQCLWRFLEKISEDG